VQRENERVCACVVLRLALEGEGGELMSRRKVVATKALAKKEENKENRHGTKNQTGFSTTLFMLF
jgi:hypothetical protein